MSRRTIPGWCTDIRYCRGRGGMSTRESGGVVRTFHSESDLGSAGSAALGGAGRIGDSTGTTTTQYFIVTGTTRGAPLSSTGIHSTEAACAAEFVQERRGLPPAQLGTAKHSIVPAEQPDLSRAARLPLEDTLNPAVKAEPVPAPSATKAMAESQGAIRRAEAPAWGAERVAEEELTAEEELAAVVVGVGNPAFAKFLVVREI